MRKNNKKNQKKRVSLLKKILRALGKVLKFFWQTILRFGVSYKRQILGFVFLFLALFFLFSQWSKGIFPQLTKKIFFSLLGKSFYFLFLVFFLAAICFFFSRYENVVLVALLNCVFLILSLSAFLGENGGKVGSFLFSFLKDYLGAPFAFFLLLFLTLLSLLVFYLLIKPEKRETELTFSFVRRIFKPKVKVEEIFEKEKEKAKEERKEEKKEKEEKISFPYSPPPLELLEKDSQIPVSGDLAENALKIKNTLLNFGIEVQMGEINVGPTVTQYTLKPAEGIKLSKISSLANNLSLALAAHPIRIEAPIPGKSLVGIEVPNKVRAKVRLRDLIASPEFQKLPPLSIVMGRDVVGNPVFANLAKMPHLLVAGATGSGKTVYLNSLILSLLYKNSPQFLRLILVDPKKVEFPIYQSLPHTLGEPLTDPDKVILALNWLTEEMDVRFEKLAEAKKRDIFSYNQMVLSGKSEEIMPFLVLIIDELADLMTIKGKEMELKIVKMAQMARAVGIHLVLATQRPSTDIVTGLIKANITSRVAFQVASQFDSRTILDVAGAEKLLGDGDLLFISPENLKPKRIQAPYVSEKEVKRIVDWFEKNYQKPKDQLSESFAEALQKKLSPEKEIFVDDPLFEQAKEIVIRERKASASFLQRRMKIGYARAARLIDLLEREGIVSPQRGSKPREVLIKEEDLKVENSE